jgi:hypothetical protein
MENVSLSIPFLVLSTKISQSGDIEKHILTPFGGIDISFRMTVQNPPVRNHYEIEVEGEIERWMYDAALIDEFRSSLVELIRGISRECLGCAGFDAEEVYVRFQGTVFNLRTSWMRPNQGPPDQSLKIDCELETPC